MFSHVMTDFSSMYFLQCYYSGFVVVDSDITELLTGMLDMDCYSFNGIEVQIVNFTVVRSLINRSQCKVQSLASEQDALPFWLMTNPSFSSLIGRRVVEGSWTRVESLSWSQITTSSSSF